MNTLPPESQIARPPSAISASPALLAATTDDAVGGRPWWRQWWAIGLAVALTVVVGLGLARWVTSLDDATRVDRQASHLLEQAVSATESGRWDDAIADSTAAIELEPDDSDVLAHAYVTRSAAYAYSGRLEEGIADANAAIDLIPRISPTNSAVLAWAHMNFATLRTAAQASAAVEAATAVIEEAPDDPNTLAQAYVERADARSRVELWVDDAVADATTVIALDPPDAVGVP